MMIYAAIVLSVVAVLKPVGIAKAVFSSESDKEAWEWIIAGVLVWFALILATVFAWILVAR